MAQGRGAIHHFAAGQCTSCSSRGARVEASVVPPAMVERLSDIRWMPRPEMCARLEDSVRVFTPIHEISEDRRPYSILGQRFITTLRPLSSASLAAASLRTP